MLRTLRVLHKSPSTQALGFTENIVRLTKLLAIALFISQAANAGVSDFQKRGFVKNDTGEKCEFSQNVEKENTYFHGRLKNTIGVIVFDNASCMSDSGAGLDTNIRQINNLVSKWYSHRDAAFQTRVSELYPSSLMQENGKCIQSKKYPSQGITIAYQVKNESIVQVRHGKSIQGCQR